MDYRYLKPIVLPTNLLKGVQSRDQKQRENGDTNFKYTPDKRGKTMRDIKTVCLHQRDQRRISTKDWRNTDVSF